MGEYVSFKGVYTKIGTCEDLYYARFDDLLEAVRAGEVGKELGNLEPVEYLGGAFRFRFPFPDEDGLGLGSPKYAYDRGVMVLWPDGVLADVDHGKAQVRLQPQDVPQQGYGVGAELPCPMDPKTDPELWSGLRAGERWLQVVQVRPFEGALWTVVRCPYCRDKWRVPPDQGAALADAIEAGDPGSELAARVRAGYARDLAAELAQLRGKG